MWPPQVLEGVCVPGPGDRHAPRITRAMSMPSLTSGLDRGVEGIVARQRSLSTGSPSRVTVDDDGWEMDGGGVNQESYDTDGDSAPYREGYGFEGDGNGTLWPGGGAVAPCLEGGLF